MPSGSCVTQVLVEVLFREVVRLASPTAELPPARVSAREIEKVYIHACSIEFEAGGGVVGGVERVGWAVELSRVESS